MDNKSFEEYMTKLEECTEKIRRSDISLEDSVKAYEEGKEYYLKCVEILESAKGRVELYRKEETI